MLEWVVSFGRSEEKFEVCNAAAGDGRKRCASLKHTMTFGVSITDERRNTMHCHDCVGDV